uniref:Pentatricopeptide repeat-containing protein At2g13600 family n=1 Tax=Cajanus cajan TaxID=3821 RepID=A0A151S656_CAJCA|nr:Pentatricopeptide repeat-containing protein At2g13600 family [Cajanus cajan]
MSFSIAHCVHQPLPHASANKVATLHHHSHHPPPIVSVPQTPSLSKNRHGSSFTKSRIQPLIDLLKSCDESGSLKHANCVHGHVLKSGFVDRDLLVLLNHAAHAYSKCNDYEAARKVFDGMSHRNVFSWTVMIVASNEHGYYRDGVELFCMMLDQGVLPDGFAFSAVLQSCVGLDSVGLGEMVHAHVVVTGFLMHTVVGTSLLNMYAKLGESESSVKVFNTMPELNIVSWNAMISGFTSNGLHLQAFDCFMNMIEVGVTPNNFTFVSVSKAVGQLGDIHKCHQVHSYASNLGLDSNTLVGTALIDMYSKCGSMSDAQVLFESKFSGCLVNTPWNAMITGYSQAGSHVEALQLFTRIMEEKDIVSWTTMVTAYCQCSEWGKALAIFSQMRNEGFVPNHFTLSSVVTACGGLCLLEFGQQIHGLTCKASMDTETCIESALIDMYAKCGNLTGAKKIFERISNPDTVSWTAIISTYAQHGLVEDALQLFRKMEQSDAKINAVTLLCILFACSHRGMVEEGLRIFHQMEYNYGVVPEMEHYACVVDLLGRVGQLNEAVEFISKMPIEPNEMVWQTLLGACRIHGNTKLGETAAQKILSTRPQHPSTYVLLSNTYIESGLYQDGVSLRDTMKERGIKKEPGYSWISIRGEVHKFYAGDQQHPQKDKIYTMLEELTSNIKSMPRHNSEFSFML